MLRALQMNTSRVSVEVVCGPEGRYPLTLTQHSLSGCLLCFLSLFSHRPIPQSIHASIHPSISPALALYVPFPGNSPSLVPRVFAQANLHVLASLKTSSTNPSRKNKNIEVKCESSLLRPILAFIVWWRLLVTGPPSRRPLIVSSVKPKVNDEYRWHTNLVTASYVHDAGSSVTEFTYCK